MAEAESFRVLPFELPVDSPGTSAFVQGGGSGGGGESGGGSGGGSGRGWVPASGADGVEGASVSGRVSGRSSASGVPLSTSLSSSHY